MTASKQPLWRYEREPAGMGEWCYGIYRMDARMAYTEELAVAIVIVGGLNRDENSHSSRPVPDISSCELGDCEGCTQQPVFTCENNVQQRIKAERERVLGLIATYCACNGIEERIIGGDRFYEVEGTFSLPDFLNYIASLRGGEQK